jgi:hypothetical protein
MDLYGAQNARWREYLFQRYVEIILKQSVLEMGKRDPEMTAYKIDALIDDITSRVHDAAAEDLDSFLFDDKMTGAAAKPNGAPPGDDGPAETGGTASAGAATGIPTMGEMLSTEFKKITQQK